MKHLKILFFICVLTTVLLAQEFPSANDIYLKAKKSIAYIYAYDQNRNLMTIGSGFCYTADGQVVSSYSLVENCKYIKIKIDGVEYVPVSIYKFDRRRDLIVYKINGKNLSYLNIGNSDQTKVGDKAFIMGHPKGYERSLLETFVSGKRDIGAGKIYFQLMEGSGCGLIGSPVLNSNAEVVGVMTNKLFPNDNVNFATQINSIKKLLESMDVKNYAVHNFFNYLENPTNYDMGVYYEEQGDHTNAIWYYLRALKDEVTPNTYRRIAYCHEQLENLQAAKDYYRLAKELEESLRRKDVP